MIEIKEYTVIDLDRHDNDYIRNCWLHIENYLAECGMKENVNFKFKSVRLSPLTCEISHLVGLEDNQIRELGVQFAKEHRVVIELVV